MRAKEGVGLSVKTLSVSFLDSNLANISWLPGPTQSKIHEFRNALNNLNQEAEFAMQCHVMTFDASITGENRERLIADIDNRYAKLQEMTTRVSKKAYAVIHAATA